MNIQAASPAELERVFREMVAAFYAFRDMPGNPICQSCDYPTGETDADGVCIRCGVVV